jgi:hypothetical protein
MCLGLKLLPNHHLKNCPLKFNFWRPSYRFSSKRKYICRYLSAYIGIIKRRRCICRVGQNGPAFLSRQDCTHLTNKVIEGGGHGFMGFGREATVRWKRPEHMIRAVVLCKKIVIEKKIG